MKRVRGWLFNLAAGVSLVLCVATAVLWVRSYWTSDAVGFTRQVPVPASRIVWSTTGSITYRHLTHTAGSLTAYQSAGWVYEHGPAVSFDFGPNIHRFLGIAYADNTWNRGVFSGTREIAVRVPYWLLLAVTGALPIARFLLSPRRRRAARAAAGLCVTCGYDLRATPERCPECGAVPEAAKGAAG